MSALEPVEVVDGTLVPWTGELLSLREQTDAQLAFLLEEARDFEQSQLRSLKRQVQDEILRRQDHAASWTTTLPGGIKLVGEAPGKTDWNTNELMGVLADLVKEGRIAQDAATEAVRTKVTYEASARGVGALLKLGGEVTERIEACRVESLRPRSVSVRRPA